MRKNQKTIKNPFGRSKNNRSLFKMLSSIFATKGILNFDFLHFGTTFHEKLPIIYANIRV
jgi:hypothetical protein